jgi:AAA family ATP:ADP antiporter
LRNARQLTARLLSRAVDVKPEERGALLLSFAYFFCVLSSYYILRPIRDEMGVAGGVRNLPWLFTGTLVTMLVAHPPFAALVARFPRARFVPYTYRFFAANLLIFFALLKLTSPAAGIWVGRAFFVWTSVFNLFVVSVFWAFMADVFRSEQGKRLFGFIALGGTLGAVSGSGITASLAEPVGPAQLMLVSVVLIELGVRCVQRLAKIAAPAGTAGPEKPIGGSVVAGVTSLVRSPYLLGILAYMLLFTMSSTFLYFQQAEIIERHFSDRAARTAVFARIDLAVNTLAIVTQAFLTGRIIRWLGVALTLTLLPALSIMGFTTLGLRSSLAALVVFQVLRRATDYAVARPTREILYTVVPREDKYKAKNLLDTFVYRVGDQISAWSYAGLVALGLAAPALAFVAVPFCGIWLVVGHWLGRRQAVLARQEAALEPAVVRYQT